LIDSSVTQEVLNVPQARDKLLEEIENYDSLNANMMFIVDVFLSYRFV
jgi:predicted RNA-binding protein with PIN domain